MAAHTYVHNVFSGDFGRNMIFHYCTKEANVVTGNSDWPRGNYCILRSGLSCPTGMMMYNNDTFP